MVSYNFDQVIERKSTNSAKWDKNKVLFESEDILDMWVADMDFPCPQPVIEAMQKRLEHPILGYSFAPDSVYSAIVERVKRRFGWRIEPEWIVFNGGVIDGLYTAVQAFTNPGDEVVIQPPVYYPFYDIIKQCGAQVLHNSLKPLGDSYVMDYRQLEQLFTPRYTFPARTPRIKAVLLCSPHNPVGRVWSKEELQNLANICLKHDSLILSDEIHCDLLSKGFGHTVMASISEEIAERTLTFMSASKTFNLAGLGTSFVIIPNAKLRRQFMAARAGRNDGNMFGIIALEAAYRYGDDYLEQLLEYLAGNMAYFTQFMSERLPQFKVGRLEGTYLAWVDMRSLGLDTLELQRFIRERARLALDDGYAFGPGGEGFQRFNIACPRSILSEALERLEKAVKEM